MSMPSNPKPQTESDQQEVDFLKSELALCFTFGVLAARKYEAGNRPSAERSIGHAEEAYSTVFKFLSDPNHSKRLTNEELRELTAKSEQVREGLDELKRNAANVLPPLELSRARY